MGSLVYFLFSEPCQVLKIWAPIKSLKQKKGEGLARNHIICLGIKHQVMILVLIYVPLLC